MSVIHGPPTPPRPDPSDLTYEAAVEATRLDYARLLNEHDLFWIAHPDGKVELGCCCSDKRFPATIAQADHIRVAIAQARGPVKR